MVNCHKITPRLYALLPLLDREAKLAIIYTMMVSDNLLSKHSSLLKREYQNALLVTMERYYNGMYRKPSQFLKEVEAIAEEKKWYWASRSLNQFGYSLSFHLTGW